MVACGEVRTGQIQKKGKDHLKAFPCIFLKNIFQFTCIHTIYLKFYRSSKMIKTKFLQTKNKSPKASLPT